MLGKPIMNNLNPNTCYEYVEIKPGKTHVYFLCEKLSRVTEILYQLTGRKSDYQGSGLKFFPIRPCRHSISYTFAARK